MVLKQEIQNDLTEAVKKQDEITRSVLRMLFASLINKEKEKRYKLVKAEQNLSEKDIESKSQLIEEELVQLIQSEIKKRREAILGFEKGGKLDLADQEKQEIKILEKYLPEQFSEQEIKKLAEEAIKQCGAKEFKDMGNVMKELMPKIKGKAEGGKVSEIVKNLLSYEK